MASQGPRSIDPTDRAHLTAADRPSPPIWRYAPSPGLADRVLRYWVTVWDLPPGVTAGQQVLQYPVCLVIIASGYAIVVGPDTGLGRVDLTGSGWAIGTMLQPATGAMLLGGPVSALTDRRVDLRDLDTVDGSALVAAVHAVMEEDPIDPDGHVSAIIAVEGALAGLGPVDEAGRLVNEALAVLEAEPGILQVAELCQRLDVGERTLQRLTTSRMGLTPKWLIQRRRLHEATLAIKEGRSDLAAIAADTGYSDQAHFTRDFRRFTGMTPGAYLRAQRP